MARSSPPRPPAQQPGRALRAVALTAVIAGVLVLAAAAFVLSYSGIHAIARQSGISAQLARGYPVIIDAMLVIAGAAVLALRGAGWLSRIFAWLVLLVLLAAVAGAGAVHSLNTAIPHRAAAAAAVVLPWFLLLVGFGLLLAMLRHFRLHRAAAALAAQPAPRQPEAAPPGRPEGRPQLPAGPTAPIAALPQAPPSQLTSPQAASPQAASPQAASPQAASSQLMSSQAASSQAASSQAASSQASTPQAPVQPVPAASAGGGAVSGAAVSGAARAGASRAGGAAASGTAASGAAASGAAPSQKAPGQQAGPGSRADEGAASAAVPDAAYLDEDNDQPAPAEEIYAAPAAEDGDAERTEDGDAERAEGPAAAEAGPPPGPQPAFHRMWSSPTPPGEEAEEEA